MDPPPRSTAYSPRLFPCPHHGLKLGLWNVYGDSQNYMEYKPFSNQNKTLTC